MTEVAAGVESQGTLTWRTSAALAERLVDLESDVTVGRARTGGLEGGSAALAGVGRTLEARDRRTAGDA